MSIPQELELWKDKGESRGQGMVGCWSGEVQQDPPPTEGRRSLDEAEVGAMGPICCRGPQATVIPWKGQSPRVRKLGFKFRPATIWSYDLGDHYFSAPV